MDTMSGTPRPADAYSGGRNEYDLLDSPDVGLAERETPPPAIGKDERRMQVRAYNFWASALGDGTFPDIASLDPAQADDFGAHGVLLDFTHGTDNPRIAFLGDALAEECDATNLTINRLSDVPSRSLLSRITDHYMEIIANQAPIGFEAEFSNQRNATILYRGILLPYSSNGSTIDYIYGVINWKELADQQTADELLLEIDQVLETPLAPRRREPPTVADWADGPGALSETHFADLAEIAPEPAPLTEVSPEQVSMSLDDWLAVARDQAASAHDREDRSRSALYEAISRAWDFALAAAQAPAEFAALLADAGLTVQERAPLTPVVKLVFGADYDKTRLTEYAAALSHAKRIGLTRGELALYLRNAVGGLKGVVAIERGFRREDVGIPVRMARDQPKQTIARRLRSLAPQSLAAIPRDGLEFALVLVRRSDAGEVMVLGEVPGDASLIEKAARGLLN